MSSNHGTVQRNIGFRIMLEDSTAIRQILQWTREGNAGKEVEENCGVKKIGHMNEMGVDLRQMGFLRAGFYEFN